MANFRFKKSSSNATPQHGIASGEMVISFGCDSCPRRQSVNIQAIGNVALTFEPMVPVSVTQDIKVNSSNFGLGLNIAVSLNQEPCLTACPYGYAIDAAADEFRQNPVTLQTAFEPVQYEF